MEKYRVLASYFHENKDLYDQMLKQRFYSEGTFQLPFEALGYPAFVVMTRDLTLKLSILTSLLNTFNQLTRSTPYLNTLMVDAIFKEIEASNEIEGIHSSRKELQLAMSFPVAKHTRFAGQIRQYIQLMDHSDLFPQNVSQIRTLYDDLLLEDIQLNTPDNVPDGYLFRKEPVYIHDGIHIVHTGIVPEEKIIELLNQSLKIANDTTIPSLVRLAIFHFLFGYIHPFYDGNGRMNRYLSTLFLASQFSPEASLQLSLCIRKKRKEYYRAFKICEDPLNKGDLTPFVLFFLDALQMALQEEIEVLKQRKKEYDQYIEKIHSLHLSRKETALLAVLAENKIFNIGGSSLTQLCAQMSLSENTLRKLLHALDRYIFTIRSGKYKQYDLIDHFLTSDQ